MLSISVHELKARLSEWLRLASDGERILVTRHGRPIAWISSVDDHDLVVGANFGKARLTAALDRATDGRFLEILAEDRDGN